MSLIARTDDGVALDAISASLNPPPDERRLKQWLTGYSDEGLIFCDGSGRNTLWHAIDPVALLQSLTSSNSGVTAPVSADSTAVAQPVAASPTPAVTPAPAAANVAPSANATSASPAPIIGSVMRPSDPDFAQMFDLAVPTIIGSKMSRPTALFALRSQAARNDKVGRAIGAYVAYALARLDTLTLADAEQYAITFDEYNAWQPIYNPRPAAEPAPTSSRAEPATTQTSTTSSRTLLPPPEMKTPAMARVAAAAAPTTAAAAVPAGPPTEAEEMEQIMKGIGLAHIVPMLKSTFELGKELFTWTRLAIALIWGLLVGYVEVKVLPGLTNLYMLQIPLTGLVWYVFLRSARRGRKAATSEIVAAIAGGGTATVFLVGIFLPILLRFANRF